MRSHWFTHNFSVLIVLITENYYILSFTTSTHTHKKKEKKRLKHLIRKMKYQRRTRICRNIFMFPNKSLNKISSITFDKLPSPYRANKIAQSEPFYTVKNHSAYTSPDSISTSRALSNTNSRYFSHASLFILKTRDETSRFNSSEVF